MRKVGLGCIVKGGQERQDRLCSLWLTLHFMPMHLRRSAGQMCRATPAS